MEENNQEIQEQDQTTEALLEPTPYRNKYKKDFKFRNRFENTLKKHNIEFRRGNAGGGNQLRQPYLKPFIKRVNLKKFPVVEHIHFFGYYIGNYPGLEFSKIKKICSILNSIN